MKKILTKIILAVLCLGVVVGLVVYEECSIMEKEHERQVVVAESAHREIDLGLNMIKIAVQTEDEDLYAKNLGAVREGLAKIKPLVLVQEEQAEYLAQLGEYMVVLEDKAPVLSEMHSLKDKVGEIEKVLKENYGNSDEISRDKVKGAKEEILRLKINEEDYKAERVAEVVGAVNETLDKMAEKAGELADCIDNCYKNKISELNDGLADMLKEFMDKAPGLNTALEEEFEFGKMEELKGV